MSGMEKGDRRLRVESRPPMESSRRIGHHCFLSNVTCGIFSDHERPRARKPRRRFLDHPTGHGSVTLRHLAIRHAQNTICNALTPIEPVQGRRSVKNWTMLCVAIGTTLAAPLLHAQTWPQRPVKVIVPFTAGGSTDTQARIISERLAVALGQQFIVDNRVGAGGVIAAEFVAKAPADGYTLFFAATPQFLIVPLIQKVNYDPLKDFAPISILGTNPFVLAVHISVPAKTLKEFIDYVKAHPGELNYSSGGTGSGAHLTAALFASRAGLKMTHIPYKGGAQSVADLVGGQIQMVFGNPSDMIQHSKSGKIRLLAVSGEKRAPQLPDLPAIAELYPGFRTGTWNGFFAPAATPRGIVDRVAQEVAKATRDPGIIERLNMIGVDALGNTPAEFAARIRSEAPLWRDAVNAAGIKQE